MKMVIYQKHISNMTREKALKCIEKWKSEFGRLPITEDERLTFLLDIVPNLNFLPESLDEAAEEYARPSGYAFAVAKRLAFKAGAEWMAGQGYSLEGEVVKYPARVLIHLNDAAMQQYLSQHTENGDKVIVQIRKKED